MGVAEEAFQTLLRQSGLSEDEFINELLQAVTKVPVNDDIWDPPRP